MRVFVYVHNYVYYRYFETQVKESPMGTMITYIDAIQNTRGRISSQSVHPQNLNTCNWVIKSQVLSPYQCNVYIQNNITNVCNV